MDNASTLNQNNYPNLTKADYMKLELKACRSLEQLGYWGAWDYLTKKVLLCRCVSSYYKKPIGHFDNFQHCLSYILKQKKEVSV